jgi:multiple sugar transport system permease protein
MPKDFWEAAALEGGGTWRSLRVALPLGFPGFITAALFAFCAAWNEFLIVLILLSNKRNTRMAAMGR